MSSDSAIEIKCPGCGRAQRLALAIGQQVMCPICQTRYVAPIVQDDLVPPPAESDGSAEDLPETREIPLPTPVPTPSLTPSGPETLTPAAMPIDESRPQEAGRTSFGRVLVRVGLVCLLLFAVIGLSLAAWRFGNRTRPEDAATETTGGDRANGGTNASTAVSDAPDAGSAVQLTDVTWTDASRAGQRMNRVQVRVEQVVFGPVRGKDEQGHVITSEDEYFLLVHVSVQNLSPLSLHYQSWYGNLFSRVSDEQPEVATMTDDSGRTYDMQLFTDVARLQGHVPERDMDPREELRDVIVYVMPPEVELRTVRWLRLQLPASAWGGEGTFYFEIPRSMIEVFESAG